MEAFDLRLRAIRPRSCRVRAGRGALARLEEELAADPPGERLFVVSDERVAGLYGEPLCGRLRRRGLDAELLRFPPGERHKTRRTKQALEDQLARRGASRGAAVLAVGGGVTGDLAGFLASTWHRGIPVVQVPTSLLAMVDAALGGKTAVNLPAGKNLVGTFHQPWGVYADVDVLATLDEACYVEGFAEMVKSAVVGDAGLFRWLEAEARPLTERDPDRLEHAVAACLRIKAGVVARDEREAGRRAVLNFGHTVGHALEAASGFTATHGRCVAAGMGCEARIAVGATGFPARHADRLERLLVAFGLPVRPPAGLSAGRIVRATHRDKKVRGGRVRYALPRRIGRMRPGNDVTVPVEERTLREVLARRPVRESGRETRAN